MGSDIQLRRDELGPEDADMKKRRESSDIVRPDGDGSAGGSKTPANAKTTAPTFTSPLGKLFLKVGELEGDKNGVVSHQVSSDLLRTHAEEFDDLRRQLDVMRNGQDRLEAMLRKFVSSGDKK
jgi:hypothetical protein